MWARSRIIVHCSSVKGPRPLALHLHFLPQIHVILQVQSHSFFTFAAMCSISEPCPERPDMHTPVSHSPCRRKLEGRAFYKSIGSPKMILAPMVDQSEFVGLFFALNPMCEANRSLGIIHSPSSLQVPFSIHAHVSRTFVQRNAQVS